MWPVKINVFLLEDAAVALARLTTVRRPGRCRLVRYQYLVEETIEFVALEITEALDMARFEG
jgi:hypothetical protein